MKILTDEVFALRSNEIIEVIGPAETTTRPTTGRWLAVALVPFEMPEGPREPARPRDGLPVEMAVVIAAELNSKGRWQWDVLSPPTKELIGDLLFDSGAERGKWYYITVKVAEAHEPKGDSDGPLGLDAVMWRDPHDPDMYHIGVRGADSLGKPIIVLRTSLPWMTLADLGLDMEQLRSVGPTALVPIELSGWFTAESSIAKGESDAEA